MRSIFYHLLLRRSPFCAYVSLFKAFLAAFFVVRALSMSFKSFSMVLIQVVRWPPLTFFTFFAVASWKACFAGAFYGSLCMWPNQVKRRFFMSNDKGTKSHNWYKRLFEILLFRTLCLRKARWTVSIFFVSLLVMDHSSELYSVIEVTSAVKILILV